MSVFGRAIIPVLLAAGCAGGRAGEALSEAELQVLEALQPRGVRFGQLTFFPVLACDLSYTDNALRATADTQEDVLHEYAPSLNIRFRPDEAVALSALYEFGWHDYSKNTARDYLSHRATADIRLKNVFIEGLSFTIGDSYGQTGNTSALENQLISFTRFHSNAAFVKTQYDFNRFAISGKYTFGLTDYFSRFLEGADYQTHTGELEGAYKFVPDRFTLFGSYGATRTLRAVSDRADFDTHTVMTGVRGTYGKLAYSVAAGHSMAQFLHTEQMDEGPSFVAGLTYSPHRRLTAALNAERRFVAGVQTGISTDTNLKATLTLLLTRRGKLNFDYTRNDSQRGHGVEQLSLAYAASFEYKCARQAVLTASFTRSEREGSGGGGFVINDARLGFKLQW